MRKTRGRKRSKKRYCPEDMASRIARQFVEERVGKSGKPFAWYRSGKQYGKTLHQIVKDAGVAFNPETLEGQEILRQARQSLYRARDWFAKIMIPDNEVEKGYRPMWLGVAEIDSNGMGKYFLARTAEEYSYFISKERKKYQNWALKQHRNNQIMKQAVALLEDELETANKKDKTTLIEEINKFQGLMNINNINSLS